MTRLVINLIAAAERSERGYVDVPPGSVNDNIESELAAFGYAVAMSDHLWIGGYRVHTPESVQAGNYRPHVPSPAHRLGSHMSPMPGTSTWKPLLQSAENSGRTSLAALISLFCDPRSACEHGAIILGISLQHARHAPHNLPIHPHPHTHLLIRHLPAQFRPDFYSPSTEIFHA